MGACDFSSAKVSNRIHECKEMEYTLWLKHTKEYNLINAYNLAVMSILAYSDVQTGKTNPDRDVSDFFAKFAKKQKLKVVKKDQQDATTAVDQFVKEVCKGEGIAEDTKGHMIDKTTSTEAFWFADQENIVLAVRGTQEINGEIVLDSLLKGTGKAPDDVVIDLDGEQVSMTGITGQVHRGFRTQAEAIINNPGYSGFISAASGKKLFITGHSLGAAVATILSAYLKEKGHDPLLYTYGSPRTGNEEFVKAYSGITHYRHVYHHDIVPIIPGRNLDMGVPELKLCATAGLLAGAANPILTLHTVSSSLYLCSQNWSGSGYYHHGNLCQIISAGRGSIMSPFEGHGVVSSTILKLLQNKEEALKNLEKVKHSPVDTDNSGISNPLEWYRYYNRKGKAEDRLEDAEDALKTLPADRNDDTNLISVALNGEVSDHFMSEGYLPFLQEEIKTQWQLYKNKYCKEATPAQSPSSDTNRRIDAAIERAKLKVVEHEKSIKILSQTILDQMTQGLGRHYSTLTVQKIEKELLVKTKKDLARLQKMKQIKIGTHSIYSLRGGDPELNKQLDKF